MSIRTTLTLDEDVVARLKEESRGRGVPFRRLVNDVLRKGLSALKAPPGKPFKIEPLDLGVFPGLNYDNIGEIIEYGEGPRWR